jgi:hypothetical protein
MLTEPPSAIATIRLKSGLAAATESARFSNGTRHKLERRAQEYGAIYITLINYYYQRGGGQISPDTKAMYTTRLGLILIDFDINTTTQGNLEDLSFSGSSM